MIAHINHLVMNENKYIKSESIEFAHIDALKARKIIEQYTGRDYAFRVNNIEYILNIIKSDIGSGIITIYVSTSDNQRLPLMVSAYGFKSYRAYNVLLEMYKKIIPKFNSTIEPALPYVIDIRFNNLDLYYTLMPTVRDIMQLYCCTAILSDKLSN